MYKSIEKNVIQWAKAHLPEFSFREHQLETICNIIKNVIDEKGIRNQIIEAPTGSGKSIICIISAGVLSEYYDKKSYILASDLYLWQQYADFIKNNNLNFGCLKGLSGNYLCSKNHEDLRNAECRVAGIKYKVLFNPEEAKLYGFECALECPYIQARKRAVNSKVTLLTYHLYQYHLDRTQVFTPRDVIFCDECHNIPDIVQSNCTPLIQESDQKHFLKMYDWAKKDSQDLNLFSETKSYGLIDKYPEREDFAKQLKSYFNELVKDNKPERDWELVNNYLLDLQLVEEVCLVIQEIIETSYKNSKFDVNDLQIFKEINIVMDVIGKLENFCYPTAELIKNENNMSYFVKNVNDTDNGKVISFSCVKEDYIIWKYLFRHATNRIMLSATVGLKEAFDDNIGIKYTEQKKSEMTRIPSTFDFSRSPIYVSEKYKMSFKDKDKSFPKLKEIVYKILEKHSNEKGMIQTGNYDNAKKLYFDAPPNLRYRLFLYENSKEKEELIKKHKESFNSVLIGPSLNEGIDLPGDLCRFIIIFKIPYPQLQDKLVQAKMKVFPSWYKSKTSNTVIQGIGRGNRFKDDYCTTYILDGCFKDLLVSTKSQYSNEMKKRMKFFK